MNSIDWDKWLAKRQYIDECDPDELVDRLCAAHRIRHVLDEIGLGDKEVSEILRRVKYPIPSRKSEFASHRKGIKENRDRYLAYLARTADLRNALHEATEELHRSYDKFSRVDA